MIRTALTLALSLAAPALADGASLADRPVRAGAYFPDDALGQVVVPALEPNTGSVGWIIGGSLGGAVALGMASMATYLAIGRGRGHDLDLRLSGIVGAAAGLTGGGLLGYLAREGSVGGKVGVAVLWALGSTVVVLAVGALGNTHYAGGY
jgi:hypothetical protein